MNTTSQKIENQDEYEPLEPFEVPVRDQLDILEGNVNDLMADYYHAKGEIFDS